MRLINVERPDLSPGKTSQMSREKPPDRPTSNHADPHSHTFHDRVYKGAAPRPFVHTIMTEREVGAGGARGWGAGGAGAGWGRGAARRVI